MESLKMTYLFDFIAIEAKMNRFMKKIDARPAR